MHIGAYSRVKYFDNINFEIMLIGQLAGLTGFSKDTIRYYEKIGLLGKGEYNRSVKNYRKYNQSALAKLQWIKKVKSLGFTLNEIKYLFLLEKHSLLRCDKLNVVISEKIQTIGQQIAELQQTCNRLETLQNNCDGRCKAMIENVST